MYVTPKSRQELYKSLCFDSLFPAFIEMYRVLKHGALAFVMSSPRQDLMWRMCKLLEDTGFVLTQSYLNWIYKTGMPKGMNVSKGIDKKLGLLSEREIISYYTIPPDSDAGNAGMNYSDMPINGNVYQDPHRDTRRAELTKPASKEAEQWDGWYSIAGLKPAHEPILMVYKPLSEPTIVDNVLKHGVGAINVDACRIPIVERDTTSRPNIFGKKYEEGDHVYGQGLGYGVPMLSEKGRFPATVLVSDRAIDTGKQSKSGAKLPHHKMIKKANVYGKYNAITGYNYPEDVGDQSRYFDLDAWAKHHGILDVPKPSPSERDQGLDGRNKHPTVKPVHLMAYLVALGCPVGGVVLDPFMGSGTTCMACRTLGRNYVGIEIEEDTYNDAVKRVSSVVPSLFFYDETMKDE
ncbi:MAG: DNA methyltransferase [Candidatus Thorarchaeota archaeon]